MLSMFAWPTGAINSVSVLDNGVLQAALPLDITRNINPLENKQGLIVVF